MELFDSHCHIQSVGATGGEKSTRDLWVKGAVTDAAAVIRRARDAGVTRLLCVGCDAEDSRLAVAFAEAHDNCWAAIGIHPHEAARYAGDAAARQVFAALATRPKVVAVGECGLDYFYGHSPREAQLALLEFQLKLAQEHELPMVFHVREAFDDFWPVFERYHTAANPVRGVLHSFTDSAGHLQRALHHNLYLGVNGIATFSKNPMQQEVFRSIPLDHLLLETDAPFLTPVPDRGKICEPRHIRVIGEFLAAARGESLAILAQATTRNARQLFNI